MFEALLIATSFVAGGVAAVAGFGIGSILTPLLSLEVGASLAVAAISIPHFVATFARFWLLRHDVDRNVLVKFGVLSAAGGLTGALLHSLASNAALSAVFAVLLMFSGLLAVTERSRSMRFGTRTAWLAGGVSGVLGGLVGNQGGIRSAALLGFQLDRQAFVATATAIGLIVDAARMPVYFATAGDAMFSIRALILAGTLGTLAGTFLGTRALRRIPEKTFLRLVGVLIFTLGMFMLWRAIQGQ